MPQSLFISFHREAGEESCSTHAFSSRQRWTVSLQEQTPALTCTHKRSIFPEKAVPQVCPVSLWSRVGGHWCMSVSLRLQPDSPTSAIDLFRMSAPVRPGARYLMAHRPGPVTALCISWLHSDTLQAVSFALTCTFREFFSNIRDCFLRKTSKNCEKKPERESCSIVLVLYVEHCFRFEYV